MSNLFALIIGINDYPDLPADKQLKGCVNDAQALSTYLQNWCTANNFNFQPKLIFNADATRQNVVNGFSQFDAATDADTCVLYYSGHGSQMKAPADFWNEPDGMFETILCYDSRAENNRDLIDKELNYLIYNATQNKRNQFVAVMDCCHSGSNTRDVEEIEMRSRQALAMNYTPRDVNEFVGYAEGLKMTQRDARHIHFGAAANDQTAKELMINNINRGIFTYSLLEILTETNGRISYKELIQRTRQKVVNRAKDQTPLLDAYVEPNQLDFSFLTNQRVSSFFCVSKDNKKGWIINAGEILGVTKDTVFEIAELNKTLQPQSIGGSYSTLVGLETFSPDKQFSATIKFWGASPKNKKRSLYLSPDGDVPANMIFKSIAVASDLVTVVDDIKTADYVVLAKENKFRFALPSDPDHIPLFRRVEGLNGAGAAQFLKDTETVVKWRNALEINNGLSNFSTDDIKIAFFDGNGVPKTDMTYAQPEPTDRVVMRASVTNTSNAAFFVSALYFCSDFSIDNFLMKSQKLNPNDTAWLELNNNRDIPLFIDERIQSWGIKKVTEHFKFFVSADIFSTDLFKQDALELDMRTASTDRSIGVAKLITPPLYLNDWRAFDVDFNITCP